MAYSSSKVNLKLITLTFHQVLSIGHPLQLQVHPDMDTAKKLHRWLFHQYFDIIIFIIIIVIAIIIMILGKIQVLSSMQITSLRWPLPSQTSLPSVAGGH